MGDRDGGPLCVVDLLVGDLEGALVVQQPIAEGRLKDLLDDTQGLGLVDSTLAADRQRLVEELGIAERRPAEGTRNQGGIGALADTIWPRLRRSSISPEAQVRRATPLVLRAIQRPNRQISSGSCISSKLNGISPDVKAFAS